MYAFITLFDEATHWVTDDGRSGTDPADSRLNENHPLISADDWEVHDLRERSEA